MTSKYDPNRNTLQSKFGFQDDDLKSSKHDEIILGVDANIEALLMPFMNERIEWKVEEISTQILSGIKESKIEYSSMLKEYTGKIDHQVEILQKQGYILTKEEDDIKWESRNEYPSWDERYLKEYLDKAKYAKSALNISDKWETPNVPVTPNSKIIKKIWEFPVKSRDYTIGFVDIFVTCQSPCLDVTGFSWSKNRTRMIEPLSFRWDIEWKEYSIALEIKSSLPSIGELVRQIRMYESYLPNTYFIVIAPDDRFASALQSQGIGFIKYE